ncbi:MAG: LamG-like jellyroll fold domain-containing protein [Candidatus Paceibacterota bacterium]|jgi:prepilin-type N-terminal cleavage/methylation domain-containing protein
MNKLIRQAFTLIELLVVIAIIGILSGMIVVSMNGVTEKATIAKSQIFSNSLRNAIMLNLISDWKFDQVNASDQTADSWNGGNTATLKENGYVGICDTTHCPQLKQSDCVSGNCLYFDGINDYVLHGSNTTLNISGKITIEAWFKTDALSATNQVIVQKSANETHDDPYRLYALLINSNSFPRFSLSTGVAGSQIVLTGNTTIQANKWYYIAGTWDGTTANIYLNGAKDNSTGLAFAGPIGTITTNLRSGNSPINSELFVGYIDNIRLYNETIPAFQIKEQYYAGLNSLFTKGNITKKEYQNKVTNLTIGEK